MRSFGDMPEGLSISEQIKYLQHTISDLKSQIVEKEDNIRQVQETHRKQARYGRDTVQKRPPKAGYATESEKLMGAQTGYGLKIIKTPKKVVTMQGLGEMGQVAAAISTVAQATAEVRAATDLVKKLTIDVKHGLAPRSDLIKAMDDLNKKIKITEVLSNKGKELSGYLGQSDSKAYILGIIVVFLIIFSVFKG